MADRANPKQGIPEDPGDEELARDWSLSSDDLTEISRCRTPYPKFHFAVQLCYLRKFGIFLDPFRVPVKITNHIHSQLGLDLVLIAPSEELIEKTRLEHEVRLRHYCGFESFGPNSAQMLENFLVGLANEGVDRDSLLLRAAEYGPRGAMGRKTGLRNYKLEIIDENF